MNIFYLHTDPKTCASYHCDKHVVKMILETAQLLCTAHHLAGVPRPDMYKPTHANHPSAVWVRSSKANYQWALELLYYLLDEYTMRYGKVHKTSRLLGVLQNHPQFITETEFTEPPQCMPDQYKCDDTVVAYQRYYFKDKLRFATYKNTRTPDFMITF